MTHDTSTLCPSGEEFATLVEAKEVLSDAASRSKYDGEHRAYVSTLQQREADQVRRSQMGAVRKAQIAKLVESERQSRTRGASEREQQRVYRAKQESIKKELLRFRELIRQQQLRQSEAATEALRRKKREEKKRKRSLIAWVDRHAKDKGARRAYSEREMSSIFKVYGEVSEVQLLRGGRCAELVFRKKKAVTRARHDAQVLEHEFGLTLSVYDERDGGDAIKAGSCSAEQKWRRFVRSRQGLTHSQFEQLVWGKVEAFIQARRDDGDVDMVENVI